MRAPRPGRAHAGYSTDLDQVLADPRYQVFFDSTGTLQRAGFVERAAAAGKAIYCEKPTAVTTAEALRLASVCERAGVKNGVVQDKLWLPGMRKLRMLKEQGFFGEILSVRGEFGYWVFTGDVDDQPAQRPIVELPQGGRRRHHHRHALPLALRDRQPVRRRRRGVVPGRDPHARARRRGRQALRLHRR